MSDREQQALQKRLLECLKRPENLNCAECSMRLPRWASTSLGVFFCTNCSGAHRGLGVHISKVKSTTLDKWTEDQVSFMEGMGNAKANEYWEANVGTQKPASTWTREKVEQFIRKKYQRGEFRDTTRNGPEEPSAASGQPPAMEAAPVGQPGAQAAAAQPPPPKQNDLLDLLSMGDAPSTTAAVTSTTTAAAAATTTTAFGNDDWANFSSAPAAPAQTQTHPQTQTLGLDQWNDFSAPQATHSQAQNVVADDGWGDFTAAPAAQQVSPQPEVAQPKTMSKTDIMSLFDAPAAPAPAPVAPGGMGGMDMLGGVSMAPMGNYNQNTMNTMPNQMGGMGGYPQQPYPPQGMMQQPGIMQQQQPMYYQQQQQQYGNMQPQFGYQQQPPAGLMQQQQQFGNGSPQMGMPGQFYQPQQPQQNPYFAQGQVQSPAPASPSKPDTQNIPEFKW